MLNKVKRGGVARKKKPLCDISNMNKITSYFKPKPQSASKLTVGTSSEESEKQSALAVVKTEEVIELDIDSNIDINISDSIDTSGKLQVYKDETDCYEVKETSIAQIIIDSDSETCVKYEKSEANLVEVSSPLSLQNQISIESNDDDCEMAIKAYIDNEMDKELATASDEIGQDFVKIEERKIKYSENSIQTNWWLSEWGQVKSNVTKSETELIIHSSTLTDCQVDPPPIKSPLPKSKLVPGTKFTVDAFNYGHNPDLPVYFLTHFHSDHYTGLNSKFKYSKVFCSQITSNLVIDKLKVKPGFVVPLPMNQTVIIDRTKVTLFGANHCPGSALILFEVPNPISSTLPPTRILHTGDFRVCSEHLNVPEFQNLDYLYLDTTYLNPSYKFPLQSDVISKVVEFSKEFMGTKVLASSFGLKQSSLFDHFSAPSKSTNYLNKKKLIVVGTYLIGKERIFLSIANALNSKVFVSSEKLNILNCFNSPNIESILTRNPRDAVVHVLKMHELSYAKLEEYLESFEGYFDEILAIKPTGWSFSDKSSTYKRTSAYSSRDVLSKQDSDDDIKFQKIFSIRNISLYGVPYSEHSSFSELKSFVESVKNKKLKIIPTVKPYGIDYREMYDYFNSWNSC